MLGQHEDTIGQKLLLDPANSQIGLVDAGRSWQERSPVQRHLVLPAAASNAWGGESSTRQWANPPPHSLLFLHEQPGFFAKDKIQCFPPSPFAHGPEGSEGNEPINGANPSVMAPENAHGVPMSWSAGRRAPHDWRAVVRARKARGFCVVSSLRHRGFALQSESRDRSPPSSPHDVAGSVLHNAQQPARA